MRDGPADGEATKPISREFVSRNYLLFTFTLRRTAEFANERLISRAKLLASIGAISNDVACTLRYAYMLLKLPPVVFLPLSSLFVSFLQLRWTHPMLL